jgi:hypothetical protein
MRISRHGLALCLALALPGWALLAQTPPDGKPQALPDKAEQLFALANQARAVEGAGPLRWDPALAAAALKHCLRMATEGPISHRYEGEADLTARAGQAGAHFSLIEENIAVGSHVATIHQGWLDSPGHRANLLNPDVDSVGVAVVAGGGVIFAVADYGRAVQVLTQTQVEAAFGGMLRAKGLLIVKDGAAARAYCANGTKDISQPGYLVRWQNPDVTRLPQELLDQLATGRYRKAAVGSCPPQNVEGSFTIYRVGVLLY